jgi:hypothetical protein
MWLLTIKPSFLNELVTLPPKEVAQAGDFRIFYTFEQPYVSVLTLRRRDEHTDRANLPSRRTPRAASRGFRERHRRRAKRS